MIERKRVRIKYPPCNHPKTCRRCGQEKPAERFFVSPSFRDGRDSSCKDCLNPLIVAKNSDPSKRAAINARARMRTKESRQRERARRQAQRGKLYASREDRRLSIQCSEAEARRAWRQWQRSAPSWWLDRYWAVSPKPWCDPRLSAAQKEVMRRRHDVAFALQRRRHERIKGAARKRGIRTERIRQALAGERGYSIPKRFDYTLAELKSHIERQFTMGMSWAAFLAGDIHLDHIRPLKSFDLNNEEQLRQAWVLSNLQPLWAEDNIKKGSTYCVAA